MKNKILSLIAMFGLSFATFAQTNTPVIPATTTPIALDNSSTSVLTEKVAGEDADVTDKKDIAGKKWKDRNLAGKILICVGGVAFIALCILLPNGWSSR